MFFTQEYLLVFFVKLITSLTTKNQRGPYWQRAISDPFPQRRGYRNKKTYLSSTAEGRACFCKTESFLCILRS